MASSQTRLRLRPQMNLLLGLLLLLLLIGSLWIYQKSRRLKVDQDDVIIRRSEWVRIAELPIPDGGATGVIRIVGDGITVTFQGGTLRGAPAGTRPDSMRGVGIHVTGKNVTIRGARISGFRVGLLAEGADGLVLEDCSVIDYFRQHLDSTPDEEDSADWLWPHENDRGEWAENYGAAFCIRDAQGVTLRRLKAREGQNGILLERISGGRIYGNDCSFLSGWGLAMWRSSGNLIARNAFDFCIRGYSHEIYNRGQDSAGILMFEQCTGNQVLENSATHSGDGIFGFAGREALGEVARQAAGAPSAEGPPAEPLNEEQLAWYRDRGNSRNVFVRNDLSYAAAHGLEITFSTGNVIQANRMVENAICGIWGGYSRETLIRENLFEGNGGMPYGRERGGVNIEHGQENVITENTFRENAAGVRLFTRPNEGLRALPWGRANGTESRRNAIVDNRFLGNEVGFELETSSGTLLSGNEFAGTGKQSVIDLASARSVRSGSLQEPEPLYLPGLDELTTTWTVGARSDLDGRERMVITEWGPYDWERPYLEFFRQAGGTHSWRLLGVEGGFTSAEWGLEGDVEGEVAEGRLILHPRRTGTAVSYSVRAEADGTALTARGSFTPLDWSVRFFPWRVDPREDADTWRSEASRSGVRIRLQELNLPFGSRGPSGMGLGDPLDGAGIPADRFGTIASATIELPAGTWTIRTRSDDGIRVWLGDEMVIDDWTWHATLAIDHSFTITEPRSVTLRVEHFELDGGAALSVRLGSAEPPHSP